MNGTTDTGSTEGVEARPIRSGQAFVALQSAVGVLKLIRQGVSAQAYDLTGCIERGEAALAALTSQPATTDTPEVSAEREAAIWERARAEIVNTPETADFMAAVPIEAAHQRERWDADHDAGKSPFDWFWLIGYLAQKAAASAVAGDAEKAKHHTISTAAALANWHAAIAGVDTSMRPGIDPPAAIREASHDQ